MSEKFTIVRTGGKVMGLEPGHMDLDKCRLTCWQSSAVTPITFHFMEESNLTIIQISTMTLEWDPIKGDWVDAAIPRPSRSNHRPK